jgi:hypothetical protein
MVREAGWLEREVELEDWSGRSLVQGESRFPIPPTPNPAFFE